MYRPCLPIALIAFAAVSLAPDSGASSNGINGFTGQFGSDCNVCHMDGTAPVVTITGPTSVAPGSTSAYTMTIAIVGSTQRAGGLDVSNDGGTFFVSDTRTQILAGEIAHSSPRPMNASREVIFSFDWQAPLSAGTYTLYGAGNAVNLAQATNGDRASTDTLAITVGAASTPGETSGDTLAPLLVTGFDPITGEISISYGNPCVADDNNIYYGPLDQVEFYSYTGEVCAIGTAGSYAGFNPGSDSVFFLVTGTQGADEGSYGKDLAVGGGSNERPEFVGNACGQAQTLADRCD